MEEVSIGTFIKSFMRDGGTFMWVILAVWGFGIGISVFKFFELNRYHINGKKLFNKIKGFVLQNQVAEAIALCSNTKAILPQILRSGLKRANEDRSLIEDSIASSINEHTPKIAYKLSYVSFTANISTLIGLLGTIQGLILSFKGVAGADPGMKAKILAEGIAKAMNTTALGLISAITIMVFHTYLTSKATQINDQIDDACAKLLDLLSIKKKVKKSE